MLAEQAAGQVVIDADQLPRPTSSAATSAADLVQARKALDVQIAQRLSAIDAERQHLAGFDPAFVTK